MKKKYLIIGASAIGLPLIALPFISIGIKASQKQNENLNSEGINGLQFLDDAFGALKSISGNENLDSNSISSSSRNSVFSYKFRLRLYGNEGWKWIEFPFIRFNEFNELAKLIGSDEYEENKDWQIFFYKLEDRFYNENTSPDDIMKLIKNDSNCGSEQRTTIKLKKFQKIKNQKELKYLNTSNVLKNINWSKQYPGGILKNNSIKDPNNSSTGVNGLQVVDDALGILKSIPGYDDISSVSNLENWNTSMYKYKFKLTIKDSKNNTIKDIYFAFADFNRFNNVAKEIEKNYINGYEYKIQFYKIRDFWYSPNSTPEYLITTMSNNDNCALIGESSIKLNNFKKIESVSNLKNLNTANITSIIDLDQQYPGGTKKI